MTRTIDQKYLTIRNYILGAIHSGRLRPGDKIPSEYGLARKFRANKTTCNKAVAILVSEGYLERKPGAGTYVLNEYAKIAPLIGVLANLRPGSCFSHMVIGIQEEAASRGYGLLFFQSPGADADLDRFWNLLLATGLKGLVINRPYVKPLPGIHNLYLNTAVPKKGCNEVQTDDFHGGYLLARHFIEMGHRHISFISQEVSRSDLVARMRGFGKGLEESGITDSTRRLHCFSKSEHNLFSVLRRLLLSDHRITAIGFDSIHIASEAYRMLKDLKKSVPDEISIGGFGNLEPGEQTLRITTIDQKPILMGHSAAEALVNVIEGRIPEPVRQVLPVDLLPGDSVRRLAR